MTNNAPNTYSKDGENSMGLFKRMYIYQKERFPIPVHGLLVASFSFSAISYSRICRKVEGFVSWKIYLVGIFITISLFLLVRIFDEFKDAEDDAKFRPELPVPRGLVSLKELGTIAAIIMIAQLVVNIFLLPGMLIIYLIIIGYLLLMGKEFFIGRWLKKNQFWYVTSHMFIIPLVDIYASGLDWNLAAIAPPTGLLFFFAVSYMNGIVLEIGRKIRIKEKESVGVLTYTAMLGSTPAIILWLAVLTATLSLSIAAGVFAGYGMSAVIILSMVFILCALPACLFLKYKTEKLTKYIEYAAAIWTIAMYLTLGGGPMITKLFMQ